MSSAKELQQQINELIRRMERMDERLSAVEQRLQEEDYRPVRQLAEADNCWPDSYSGMVDLMDRNGVPKRTRGGATKEKGSRRTTYVSMYDLQKKC
jgi:hypothetical protein